MKDENQNLKQKFVPLAVHERREKRFREEYYKAIIGSQLSSAIAVTMRNEIKDFCTDIQKKPNHFIKKRKR